MKFSSEYQPEKKGRTKGKPNRLTAETRDALAKAVSGEVAKVPELLAKLEPKDRLELLAKLLQYILPRLKEEAASYEIASAPSFTFKELVSFSSE